MLQVLEDGHLTDSKGYKIRFSGTLIIFTTNLGAKELLERVSNKSSYGSGEINHSTFEKIAKAKAEEYGVTYSSRFWRSTLNLIS